MVKNPRLDGVSMMIKSYASCLLTFGFRILSWQWICLQSPSQLCLVACLLIRPQNKAARRNPKAMELEAAREILAEVFRVKVSVAAI